jgi:hypothetical protein
MKVAIESVKSWRNKAQSSKAAAINRSVDGESYNEKRKWR